MDDICPAPTAAAAHPAVGVSVVVPCYNEAPSLRELVARIIAVMQQEGLGDAFEIVLVDDGSRDGSPALIADLVRETGCVRAVLLRVNSGKALALMAGFRAARGAAIVTMDGDLQDNPEDIPRLVAALDQGYDVANGWRRKRRDTLFRRLGSRLYNRVVAAATGLRLSDLNCGFKAYRREVTQRLVVFGQYHRYIPVQAHLLGFRVTEVPISNSPRRYGTSRYPALRYEGLFDLLSILFTYRYSLSPLHFFGQLSLVFLLPGGAAVLWLLLQHLIYFVSGDTAMMIVNRPLLTMGLIACVVGLLIFLTGFLCDFILHHQIRHTIGDIVDLRVDRVLEPKAPAPPPKAEHEAVAEAGRGHGIAWTATGRQ